MISPSQLLGRENHKGGSPVQAGGLAHAKSNQAQEEDKMEKTVRSWKARKKVCSAFSAASQLCCLLSLQLTQTTLRFQWRHPELGIIATLLPGQVVTSSPHTDAAVSCSSPHPVLEVLVGEMGSWMWMGFPAHRVLDVLTSQS